MRLNDFSSEDYYTVKAQLEDTDKKHLSAILRLRGELFDLRKRHEEMKEKIRAAVSDDF